MQHQPVEHHVERARLQPQLARAAGEAGVQDAVGHQRVGLGGLQLHAGHAPRGAGNMCRPGFQPQPTESTSPPASGSRRPGWPPRAGASARSAPPSWPGACCGRAGCRGRTPRSRQRLLDRRRRSAPRCARASYSASRARPRSASVARSAASVTARCISSAVTARSSARSHSTASPPTSGIAPGGPRHHRQAEVERLQQRHGEALVLGHRQQHVGRGVGGVQVGLGQAAGQRRPSRRPAPPISSRVGGRQRLAHAQQPRVGRRARRARRRTRRSPGRGACWAPAG